MGSAVGAGIDCERLLENFAASGSLLYKDFVNEWHKMKFALIFRGRNTIFELIEFTEEIFSIAKSYLFPPHSMSYRVGSIYLLYGLYYRQPTQSKSGGHVKIRIEYDEWLTLKEFIEKLKDHGYLDACYVYYKMVIDNVFHFVCFSRQYSAERRLNKERKHMEMVKPKLSSAKATTIVNDLLEECNFSKIWKKREAEYNEMKKEVLDSKLVDSSVKMDETSFIEEVTNDILQQPEISVTENTSKDTEMSIGSRREAIKLRKKSDKAAVGGQRSRLAHLRKLMMNDLERQTKETVDSTSPQKNTSGKGKKSSSTKPNQAVKKISFVNDAISEDDTQPEDMSKDDGDNCNQDMPSLMDIVLTGADFLGHGDSGSSSEDESHFYRACSEVLNSSNKETKQSSSKIVDAASLLLFH